MVTVRCDTHICIVMRVCLELSIIRHDTCTTMMDLPNPYGTNNTTYEQEYKNEKKSITLYFGSIVLNCVMS